MSKSIKKNTVYNFVKTIFSIAFPVITTPYVLRILQPENYGKVQFTLSIISYFSLIATLGINAYAIRECSSVKSDRKTLELIASQIFSISIITSIFSLIFLFFSVLFIPKLTDYCLLFTIESLSIVFVILGADWINTSMGDFKYIAVRTVAFQIISFILIFIFVKKSCDYVIYICILMFSSCGANIMNIFYRRKFCNIGFTFSINLKKHFSPIIYLFLIQVAQVVLFNIDSTMLGFILGDYYVGLYSLPTKIISVGAQVVSSITWVVLPQLTKLYSDGNIPLFNTLLQKSFNYTLTLTIPLVVVLVILADDIVIAIGGTNYISSSVCLIVLSFVMICDLCVGNLFGNCVLLTTKKDRMCLNICLVGMILNSFANYLLIPMYGILGAALSTSLSKIVCDLMIIRITKVYIKECVRYKIVFPPIVGGAFVIISCVVAKLLLNDRILILLLSSILGFVSYFIAQIVLKNEIIEPIVKRIKFFTTIKSR